MENIRDVMAADHRQCDELFAAVERALGRAAWADADAGFSRLRDAMSRHFDAEEAILFPAFEAHTGMSMGPTRVMRNEHDQMRELLDAAKKALEGRDAEDYSGTAETLLIMMQQHNTKEENILYPMCDLQLAGQQQALLAQLKDGISGALK
jgi:iron-sulfur cluster repair protein YtfE (RIC family)